MINRLLPFRSSFVNNAFVGSVNSAPSRVLTNPSNSQILLETFDATPLLVDEAVQHATCAFEGDWASWSGAMRRDALLVLAETIERDKDLLGFSEAIVGKPIADSKFDVDASVECFRFFAGAADKNHGRSFAQLPTHNSFTRREPIGVCGLITSFNYPLLLASWKLAPALASGNTVILKPSPQTPFSTLILASLAKPYFPPGVINVLLGDQTIGSLLCKHDGIHKISFTGSTIAGSKVASSLAYPYPRKATLELGGKNSIIIHKDAPDLERAVSHDVDAAFSNAGQNCCAGSRLLVHESVYDAVLEILRNKTRELRVGDPLQESTRVGPVVDEVACLRILDVIQAAVQRGGKLDYGGSRLGSRGYFIEPTIVSNVGDHDSLAQEEVFGPVLAILRPFKTMEEAVERANRVRYGLAAGVFTDSLKEANIAVHGLKAGFVWVNTYNDTPPYLPLGGIKGSGYGKECGLEAMNEFSATKSVHMKY
ncbi:aldehyde dehydrogenase domain-containing protein [Obelidium mucronatum]|nr:aldehyde dehydrogenase domain-containing protein [Obelidium mucronatum]